MLHHGTPAEAQQELCIPQKAYLQGAASSGVGVLAGNDLMDKAEADRSFWTGPQLLELIKIGLSSSHMLSMLLISHSPCYLTREGICSCLLPQIGPFPNSNH